MLSRTNLFDPSSIELAYYKDSEKKTKQKKTIDLQLVVNVSPVQKSGNKENVFALDMKGKHVLLKASNILVQNVWLAKLLECCSKGERSLLRVVVREALSLWSDLLSDLMEFYVICGLTDYHNIANVLTLFPWHLLVALISTLMW